MKKQLLALGIALFVLAIGLYKCVGDLEEKDYNITVGHEFFQDEFHQDDTSKFVGTWIGGISNLSGIFKMMFYTNGTVKKSFTDGLPKTPDIWWEKYKTIDHKICFQISLVEIFTPDLCYDYKFSNDNCSLLLLGAGTIWLEKR